MRCTEAVQSVKEHMQQGTDNRAAGELEGQRSAARDLKDAPIWAALRGKDLGRSADFSCVAERKNGTVHAVPFTRKIIKRIIFY